MVWVSAISDYDLNLFEDNTKNRLQESVELFADTINNPAFTGVPVMIFLNKKDLFEKKFEAGIGLNVSGIFPDAPAGNDVDKGARRSVRAHMHELTPPPTPIVQRWRGSRVSFCPKSRTRTASTCTRCVVSRFACCSGRQLTRLQTCATDPNNVRTVFDTCRQIIIKRSLESSGFKAL